MHGLGIAESERRKKFLVPIVPSTSTADLPYGVQCLLIKVSFNYTVISMDLSFDYFVCPLMGSSRSRSTSYRGERQQVASYHSRC